MILLKKYGKKVQVEWLSLDSTRDFSGVSIALLDSDCLTGFSSYGVQFSNSLNLLNSKGDVIVEMPKKVSLNTLYYVKNSLWKDSFLKFNELAIERLNLRLKEMEDYQYLFEKPRDLKHYFISFNNLNYLHILASGYSLTENLKSKSISNRVYIEEFKEYLQ